MHLPWLASARSLPLREDSVRLVLLLNPQALDPAELLRQSPPGVPSRSLFAILCCCHQAHTRKTHPTVPSLPCTGSISKQNPHLLSPLQLRSYPLSIGDLCLEK